MNLMEIIGNANNGAAIEQMAGQLGISTRDAQRAMGQLLPALTRGVRRNVDAPGGLESLLGALAGGRHQRYLEQPEILGRRSTIDDGNGILGHIFGSKDVSRNVAGHAAQETGIDAGILKKMLPMLASLAMGALSQKMAGGGGRGVPSGGGGGGGFGGGLAGSLLEGLTGGSGRRGASSGTRDILTGLLDSDGDGSVVDDVLGMAKKFF